MSWNIAYLSYIYITNTDLLFKCLLSVHLLRNSLAETCLSCLEGTLHGNSSTGMSFKKITCIWMISWAPNVFRSVRDTQKSHGAKLEL